MRRLAVWAFLFLLVMLLSAAGCGHSAGVTGAATTSERIDDQTTAIEDLSGLGDEYFPQAGNAGYDVLHYDITLDCDPRDGALSGTTVILAKALADLSEFNLDLIGLEVRSIQVNGVVTSYRRSGQELVVECSQALHAGDSFEVSVVYSGTPRPLASDEGYPEGWQHSGDTVFTLDEPEGAAAWYPLNDHPSDKATYSFHLTVPAPYVAVANGNLVDTEDKGGQLTYDWEMAQPMANYLAAVGMGDFVLEQTVSPGGVTIRDYYARDLAEEARSAFASTGRALDFFVGLFGPYPFDSYGVLVPDASTDGSAMENQTMSLFGRDTVEESMASDFGRELFLSHELAHQWFGNSVTLAQWKDVWLNEGFAMYASWMWLEQEYGADALQRCVDNAYDILSSEDGTLLGDPGKYELFGRVVYERGGLTLHALRGAVGDELFVEILRDWASQNAYGCVTTRDFIDLVKTKTIGLTGFDAETFFDNWLYQEELPNRTSSAQSTR